MATRFNPFTKKPDIIEDDVITVTSASTAPEGIEIDTSGVVWYRTSTGDRYKISGTLDNPVITYSNLLLEDGTSFLLLENGDKLLLEA